MTHKGGNPKRHTQPVKVLRDIEKARIKGELAQISILHRIVYTLERRGNEWRIMIGMFPSGRVDLVTRSNRKPFLVVSGIEWVGEVAPIS